MYCGPLAPKVFGQRYSWVEHGMKVDPQGGWVNADDFSELSKVDEKIISLYQPLLDAIPPCPAHGANCIAHAIEWIEKAKANVKPWQVNGATRMSDELPVTPHVHQPERTTVKQYIERYGMPYGHRNGETEPPTIEGGVIDA